MTLWSSAERLLKMSGRSQSNSGDNQRALMRKVEFTRDMMKAIGLRARLDTINNIRTLELCVNNGKS